MKKLPYLSILAMVLCCFLVSGTTAASAGESLGVAVKAGTTGLGAELSVSLIPHTRLRGGFSYLNFSFDSTIDEVDYEFKPEFNAVSLLLDVHPFGGAFFLSGGVYFNNNTVDVTGSFNLSSIPSAYASYGSYAELFSVSGDVEFNKLAPYAGIGWRTNSDESGWGFIIELGVLFQGAPSVDNLRINGPVDVNGIPEVQRFLAGQEREIEDELEWFELYPVATAMLVYHF